MQGLTADYRSIFTAAQITALLASPRVTVGKGLELLAPDLTVRADITTSYTGGTIKRDMAADIHGTCSLSLTRELTWGVDLVRPYRTLSDGRITARWNRGVFALSTPTTDFGSTLPIYTASGQDRLSLLNRQVGASYSLAAGLTYYAAFTQVFADAGLTGVLIDSTATALTLPAAKSYPLVADTTATSDATSSSTPVTWLQIVNDLATACNFRGVWADENGLYRLQPYVAPTARPVEYVFTADAGVRLLGPKRTRTRDVWSVPNRWVFIAQNPPSGTTPSTSNGLIYQVDNTNWDALSQAAYPAGRGLVWPSVLTYDAADAATLAALGNRKVALDRAAVTTFDVTTSPFPGAGHVDVFSYADAAAGGTYKVQANAWSEPQGADVTSWTWQVVT